MSREWLGKLYEKEIRNIKTKLKHLKSQIEGKDLSEVDDRNRDYILYRDCVNIAFNNDLNEKSDRKITTDEKSILNVLAHNLDLSQEEIKLLNYSVLPLVNLELENLIDLLKSAGIILYSKKDLIIYVPDEFVRLLRKYRNKEVADKYLKRILRLLTDPEINLIARKHGINRKLETRQKIKSIINEGIGIRNILKHDIHKENTSSTSKKSRINNLVEKGLNISHLKGTTIDTKIDNLVQYFNDIEKDEKVGISIAGYNKLLEDLNATSSEVNNLIKIEFELQKQEVSNPSMLLDYNIKPRDILEILAIKELKQFCDINQISTRGNEVLNILNAYKDSVNIELESYVDIATRDLIKLKENGIRIKEADLGNKFEELTRIIFNDLRFNVDEHLRKSINTTKDKIDIVLRLSEDEVILVECKSVKKGGFDKFSAVSRQIRSYIQLLEKNEFHVVKTLLVAPEFSDSFINDTGLDYKMNLSLIRATSLLEILSAFKAANKLKDFPYQLLMKDVVVNEERIIKALGK